MRDGVNQSKNNSKSDLPHLSYSFLKFVLEEFSASFDIFCGFDNKMARKYQRKTITRYRLEVCSIERRSAFAVHNSKNINSKF